MNLRTRSIYPYAGNYYPVDIFGYTSHGIPGLEIVGLGKYGKSVKEKFIYLTRVKNLKVPKKRYSSSLNFFPSNSPSTQMTKRFFGIFKFFTRVR